MKKLPSNLKKMLIDEFKFAIEKMEKEEDFDKKLYYFSALYSVLSRVFNVEFDPELVFIHLVLNTTHNTLQSRLASIRRGEESVIKIPEEVFEKLTNITRELLVRIEKNRSTHDVLQKLATIAYMTTGNGYYLYERGLLRLG